MKSQKFIFPLLLLIISSSIFQNIFSEDVKLSHVNYENKNYILSSLIDDNGMIQCVVVMEANEITSEYYKLSANWSKNTRGSIALSVISIEAAGKFPDIALTNSGFVLYIKDKVIRMAPGEDVFKLKDVTNDKSPSVIIATTLEYFK